MLPAPIQEELFDLRHRVSDSVTEFLVEELHKRGFEVTSLEDFDTSIFLWFENRESSGEIHVDRMHCDFSVVAKCGDYTVLPMEGDWATICEYLDNLAG